MPARCDCPHLPTGTATPEALQGSQGGHAFAEWMAQNCACCQHLRWTEGWTRCAEGCIWNRFPVQVHAEWELTASVMDEQHIPLIVPMGGGTIHTRYRISSGDWYLWVRDIARIPRARWATLIRLAKWYIFKWQEGLKGTGPLSDAEFVELGEIGVTISGGVVADDGDGPEGPDGI